MEIRHMSPSLAAATALTLVVLSGTACAPLTAQELAAAPGQQATRSPEELLVRFAEEERSGVAGQASEDIFRIFRDPVKYPRATVEALLNGLERLALTSNHPYVRTAAAATISMAGWSTSKSPLSGIVARQVRIYQRTSDPMVRSAVVSSLTGAAETKSASAFLRTIALQSSRRGDFPNAPISAIRALTRLGEDGPATLRELHQNGQVRDREALGFLEQLSKTGYRQP